MSTADLQSTIDSAFDARDEVSVTTTGPVREAVEEALNQLDSGKARVAEKTHDGWIVNLWLKKAVLLSFRLNDMGPIAGGPGQNTSWWDKVPSKFEGWGENRFREAGFRAVPNCIVRRSAYVAPGVVLMPSFVNLGAYVDSGTMVDTWATVGSCAQIGKNVHLSGGAGIGGVLEPPGRSGHHRRQLFHRRARRKSPKASWWKRARSCRWVFSSGPVPRSSTATPAKSIWAACRPFSVVVPGTLPGKPLPDGSPGPSLYCAVIVKRVDERTRSKTSINDLLRD